METGFHTTVIQSYLIKVEHFIHDPQHSKESNLLQKISLKAFVDFETK